MNGVWSLWLLFVLLWGCAVSQRARADDDGIDKPESCRHRRLSDLTPIDPSYYDTLRNEGTELNSSHNIYQVSDPNTNQIYRLAELKTYVPFTDTGTTFIVGTATDAFAAMLALYHFNNVALSPILTPENVSACTDLKFTTQLLDSQSNPIETTRLFTQMIKSSNSLSNPSATGMVGAYRSAVTLPLAILSGVNGIPQVSPAASAIDFDDKDQYPLFGRMVCNSPGEAQVAVDFFQSIGSTHVLVLYVTDTYGSALQKAFQDAASQANITTEEVPVSYFVKSNSPEVQGAIHSLSASQYRHVYAICFGRQLETIMSEAVKQGVVGADYLWIFPAITPDDYFSIKTFPSDSPLESAFKGIGLINPVGGVHDTEILASLSRSEEFAVTFEKFHEAWHMAMDNPDFLQFVKNALPSSLDGVSGYNASSPFDEGGAYSLLLYDAMTSMALAMCNTKVQFFNGSQVFDAFRNHEFYGSSGLIRLDNFTGTRDYKSLRWAVWNSHRNGTTDDGLASFNFAPAFHYTDSRWKSIPDSPFVYASGKTVPPDSLPPTYVQNNYIGTTGRVVGYVLMGITMLSAVLSLLWLCYYRCDYVVMSAQPLFLLMVSVGAFIMAITILPLGFEETVVDSQAGLNKACMSVPWLYIMGSTFPLSAMTAKIRGVHKAYMDPEIDFIQVTNRDLVMAFGPLFLVNLILLIIWTAVAPLHWVRTYSSSVDQFGRENETYASCYGENAVLFWSLLAVVNLGVLVLCNWWAYRSRNIETEFHESSYVGVSAAAVLQAWCMGIPIIIVVVSDSPQASFYVSTGIVFVTSQAVISLIYVPKVLALRTLQKEELEKKKTETYQTYLEQKSKSVRHDEDDDDDEHDNHHHQELVGDHSEERDRVATAPLTVMTLSTEDIGHNPQEPLEGVSATNGGTQEALTADYSADKVSRESKSEPFSLDQQPKAPNDRSLSVSWGPASGTAAASPQMESDRQQASGGPTNLNDRVPLERSSSSSRRKFSIFPVALRSALEPDSGDGTTTTTLATTAVVGPKILHNPRTKRNLAVSGGYELSRQQIEALKEMEEVVGANPAQVMSGEDNLVLPTNVNEAFVPTNCSPSHNDLQVMEAVEEPDDEEQDEVEDGDVEDQTKPAATNGLENHNGSVK